ncbi:MAG: hypothetical protein ABI688_00110 [Bacteroidota bacterium]
MLKLIIAMGFLGVLPGCFTPGVQTIWKAEQPLPYRYNKILVVAIIPGGNDSLQAVIENQTVNQLILQGYQAVSYVDGFSIYGISQSATQEAAYFTLCEKGIDCILTIAKVDPGMTVSLKKGTVVKYPASFYFNHIWDYRGMMKETTTSKQTHHVWECILFDLRSLEQQSVLQVNDLTAFKNIRETEWVPKKMIARMLSDKIISRKQPTDFPIQRKGF